MINNKEFESLGDGYFVATSKDHKFCTDSFLLANFFKARKKDIVADIGTGCGILSILIYKKYTPKKIYAFDILESATYLAKKSIVKSKLEEKIKVLCQDIKYIDKSYYNKFDRIICNPPYKMLNSGKLSKSKIDRITRHETTITLEDIFFVAGKMLKYMGSIFLSVPVERLKTTLLIMSNNNIEPKTLQFCSKDKNSAPWLFLVEGKKCSKPFMKVLPTIFMYEENKNI